ncbi:TetR/AcrR family transcriptional regulator [Nonomuraea angiospora]|uniref:TetR/AcrR family transcriptional regulator n=1 Tax=Nonomuraea angiospora TaxID=46172 RepID=UPI0037952229
MAKGRYHHGDLRAALLDAAEELVRERGADGWSLREASARVGVSPSAAYHHFASRDALVRALSERLLSRLGDRLADACERAAGESADPSVRERVADPGASGRAAGEDADPDACERVAGEDADPGARDRAAAPHRRLIALGHGYLRWAVEDPAVARLVFGAGATGPDSRVSPHPHDVLTAELDRLADLGALPAASRPGAEFVVWAPIHGLAVLLIDGLIRVEDARAFDLQAERVIRATLNGLCHEPAPAEGWPAVHTTHTDRRRSHLGQEGEQVGPGAGDLLRQAE